MTENALLVVSHPGTQILRLAGMTVLERQLWTLARAGIKRVWVAMTKPALALRAPEGLEIVWAASSAAAELHCLPPYLSVSGDHFIRVETLAYIVNQSYPASVALYDSDGGATVVRVVFDAGDRMAAPHRQPLPAGSTCRLDGGAARRALPWLLALGIKGHDGFMARHFDRYISLSMTRLLLNTRVTPNMMTIASSLIGLAGAAFFLDPSWGSRLTGALLVLLHSVLDGCDGELARIRFQESPLGADIDFWGDNIVHVALFGCLSYGFFKADQNWIPPALGLLAAAGTIGSASLSYLERLERRRGAAALAPQPTSALARLAQVLAARDFIYLLVVLAYIDRLFEFLWAAAIGSLLFFFMTLYTWRNRDEQNAPPHPTDEGKARGAASGHGSGHEHLHSRSRTI